MAKKAPKAARTTAAEKAPTAASEKATSAGRVSKVAKLAKAPTIAKLAKARKLAKVVGAAQAPPTLSGAKAPRSRGAKAHTLIIVESPAKAKTIQKYLGAGYVVIASKGHIKDLPKRGGVDVENGFQESYEFIKDKGTEQLVRSIETAASRAGRVLLATDPDREGEAIAFHLAEEILRADASVEVRRVLFNEITHKGVEQGIAAPRDLDVNLYEAQRTRRVLDRIGGYPLSNLLWRKLAFGLSAGRVQTPALRIIVDRQHEIDAFVPRPYWLIEARVRGEEPPPFTTLLDTVDGEKLEKVSSRAAATSELDAKRFEEDLKIASYRVAKLVKRERRVRAPAPYTTSKLQQDAANRLGMQPKRAMRIAQGLYEGVLIGRGEAEETVGLITYMRTDSVRVSADAVTEVREFVRATYGASALPPEPNVFKSKGPNVQDAHEAVRPTRMDLPPSVAREFLSDERYRLYALIWNRFVASQMVPAVYDQTGVDIEGTARNHVYGLHASGSVLKVAGWRSVYGEESATDLAGEESESVTDDGDARLPVLREGETIALDGVGVVVSAKQTEPPPHYSEASLVKKLEEEGIGRPSTYAEIISKVQARDYVRKDGGKLVPSDLGRLVVDRLVADGFDLADLDFSRKLEADLDAVAEARAKRLDILAPFHKRLQEQIEASLEDKSKWWPVPEEIGEACPECGKALYKRWGRNGPFIGCPGYPECKYTRPILLPGQDPSGGDGRPQLTDHICKECSAPMLKRLGRNGWFLGCSTYPKCKHTRNLPLGVACPKCGGEVVEIRGKQRRRPFYGCTNYSTPAKCDFRLYQRPYPEKCPRCDAAFLVRAGNVNAPTLRCVTEGCGHEQPFPTNEEGGAPEAPKLAAGSGLG